MKYIIPMLVGSIIGYATNWLAIRMLFRPHYEKKFLGFKIPFTPGLIPKEKTRIAKNIGETVGEYLLSPIAISETLLSEETNKDMEMWIKSNIKKLKEDKKPIKDLFENLPENQVEEIKSSIEILISNSIIQEVQNEKTRNKILDFIRGKLYDEKIYEKLSFCIKEVLGKVLKSEELQEFTEGKIEKELKKISKDDRILKEALPKNIEIEINKYFDGNIENIGNHIREIIESPNVQSKIKKAITNMVDQNISRIITSFITAEAISEKIYSAIENYINDESSNEDILFFIKSFIDKIMESKLSELAPRIVEKIDSAELSKYLLKYIGSQENQDEMITLIDKKIKNIDREEIMESLSKEIESILKSHELENQVEFFIKSIIDNFMNKTISDIVSKLENNMSNIYKISKAVFDQFVISQLPSIVEMFNISKIVEDEINKFDVEFTEKLILDIANKELKAITWLGALLGAVLGLLSPLLQLL